MTKTIKCHRCHRELPEDSYYNSSLNRGYIFCKDCCKEWNKEAKKRYIAKRKSIKNYKETIDFNSLMGGYTISMIYNPKYLEHRYCLTDTKRGKTFFIDEPSMLEKLFHKALRDIENGKKKN